MEEDKVPFTSVNIESILENPDVVKKNLAQNVIQATGHREDKSPHFVIHFKNRALHGNWQSYYDNDQLCDSGMLKNNLPDGVWKTWYPSGKIKSITHYSAEKYRFIQADIRRSHPRLHHYAITKYAKENQPVAQYFRPLFATSVAAFQSLTMLEKIQHNTSDNDGSYIAPFKDCVHHGMYISYYESGAVKDSGHFVNGLKHGLWEETLQSGNITSFGLYHHGKKNSQWKYYNKEGNLLYTEHYKRNGNKKSLHHFKK